MSERIIYLYEYATEPFDFNAFCYALNKIGLTLEHPVLRSIFKLDLTGDQVCTSRYELQKLINQEEEVSLQFWYEENHDIYCRFRVKEKVRVIELGMEGTTDNERESLKKLLISLFFERVRASIGLGLVFDPNGNSVDYDWDQIFVYGCSVDNGSLSTKFPQLLLISNKIISRFCGFKYSQFIKNITNIEHNKKGL